MPACIYIYIYIYIHNSYIHTHSYMSICTYACIYMQHTCLNMNEYSLIEQSITYVIEEHIICDRICENVHSSHIQFFNFEDS